jgi:hypothetical protein
MAKIEIVLRKKVADPRIRNIKCENGGMKLVAEGFEELTLLGETDIKKLCSLPIEQVTILNHSVGEISTAAGVYLLEGGATVQVMQHSSASVKFRQMTAFVTINAPSIQSFMDTFAMTMNNKLLGLELIPSDTQTYRRMT